MDRQYDLEDRTKQFSLLIIQTAQKSAKNVITNPLLSQLIRSATSIGANYREANGGSSRKDFRNKIFICKKEAKETKYWLELLSAVDVKMMKEYKILIEEADELVLIFSKIASRVSVE